MKCLTSLACLLVFLSMGCAHQRPSPSPLSPPPASLQVHLAMMASDCERIPWKSPGMSAALGIPGLPSPGGPSEALPEALEKSGKEGATSREIPEGQFEAGEEKPVSIADPLEPFNRVMFRFNNKLYFWVIKPVAQGYQKVVPEKARVSVRNFFYNLLFPMRFVSCLLRADFGCAGTEIGRFTVNTLWGVGGLLDPASHENLNIPKNAADLGQTLGVYGLGQGFYIVWPVLGPSSARDSINIPGNYFLYVVNYISPWYEWLGVRVFEVENDASLRIGDYESLLEAAIDPYVALRNAYAQYRQGMVEAARGKPSPTRPPGVRVGH
jgi:phospholipid-binding lipoprotein MlaA